MKPRGFSLLEVLIAMSLVSFLLAGTAELILHSIQAQGKADDQLRLTAFIAARLESLKTLPFESADLQPGLYRDDAGPEYQAAAARAEWQIENLPLNAKKIDFQAFDENRPERAIRAVVLLSGYLGF